MNIDPVSSITQEDSPQLPELRRHDFERPDYERPRALAKNLELPLKLWLSSASGLFNENWQPLTSQQVCLAHHAATVESFLSFKDNCPDHCWSIHARIGKPEFETAFVMDRRLVLAIVATLINESAETDPESVPTEITSVEAALSAHFAEAILDALQNTWIGIDPLQLGILEYATFPRRSPLFVPSCSLANLQFQLEIAEQPYSFCWLLPERELVRLLSSADWRDAQSRNHKPGGIYHHDGHKDNVDGTKTTFHEPYMQRLAQNFEMNLRVQLGSTAMNVSQLQQLQVGDVIPLNHSTEVPLQVSVGGIDKFAAIPGQKNDVQTIQIVQKLA